MTEDPSADEEESPPWSGLLWLVHLPLFAPLSLSSLSSPTPAVNMQAPSYNVRTKGRFGILEQ